MRNADLEENSGMQVKAVEAIASVNLLDIWASGNLSPLIIRQNLILFNGFEQREIERERAKIER